ncbi:MAG TPA: MOSC domain-containing protein [Gallionellaceae bacterium]
MQILSVNVGASRTLTIKEKTVHTGLYKMPMSGPVRVTRLGLQNDVLIEHRPMGLEHHAVYAYPHEHYAYWQRELGREPFPLGQFGENLTVTGLLEEEVRIGDIFRFGGTVLQVAQPRIPCAKLDDRMGMRFARMFLASRKVGYYLRVLQEGSVAQGDTIELIERDENSPTMEEFVRVTHYEYWDALALQHLLQARDLMPAWRETIEGKLALTLSVKGWHGLREFEVVRREEECRDTFSLYLKCARGRELAPFHGGQKITVVLGGHTPNQDRRAYALSGSPRDLASYRITVRHMLAPDAGLPAGIVSSHLNSLKVGDRIQCTAPHGALMHHQKQSCNACIPLLVSHGMGIAPMLSLLYELEANQAPAVLLFHEPSPCDPQGLLREVRALMARNPGFRMLETAPGETLNLDAELISYHAPMPQADVHIAGPRSFVDRLSGQLKDSGIEPSVMMLQSFG